VPSIANQPRIGESGPIIVEEEKRLDFTALAALIRAAYKFFVNLEPSYEDRPFETGSGRDLYM
jgi:hypothetical protein